MDKLPFATIIVPTYNQEAFLPQALDSLLSQTDADWEAIVVNDGSTDRTADIAEDYTRRDGRIRYMHKPNGGVASALNLGLKNARGEWIHWLSSDDMFEPSKLAINRHWIEQHPDINFFFSYFTLLTEATGAKERRDLWGPLPEVEHQILAMFYRNYISGITICVKRTAWETVGFFEESLYYAQDYGQWLQLLQTNQAVFIPEWTVINRNHAAQGSETFADACYFDTAKAAIRFINQHSFSELVPGVNLSHNESATKAVRRALDVACDRTAFLYGLGPHPALLLRVLEWVFSDSCHTPALRTLVRSRIAEMSFVEGDDDWAWMWRQLAVAVHDGRAKFLYSPIDISQLALRLYQSGRICNDRSRIPLRDYLSRFAGLSTDQELPPAEAGSRIVFAIDRLPESHDWRIAAERLARRGYRLLWLVSLQESDVATFEWSGWLPLIRVTDVDRDTLPWLGEVERVVTLPGSEPSPWLASLSHSELAESASAAEVEALLMAELEVGKQERVRPVVFLERVLWGGGAERVVFDLVRHMDRRRFRPVILTMFEEQTTAPCLPEDIDVFNVRHQWFGETLNRESPRSSLSKIHAINRMLYHLRRMYHRLLTPDVRMRLGLGQRLSILRQSVLEQPVRSRSVLKQPMTITPAFDCDFISAMGSHNPAAVGLIKAMNQLGKEAVLVAVMEEATVVAWLAQAALRFPYMVSLHTLESACLRTIYHTPARYLAERHLLTAACNDADMVVFPTQGCCSDMKEAFSVARAKFRTIWNPVDCARVRRQSFQRIEAVEQWREKTNCFRIVHVGRLDPQKNHDLLLAACAELKARQRAFSLSIVGDGHDRPNIEQRIHTLDLVKHVSLVGEQQNPFPWIAAADVLLLTSRFEAFALVLVEAMVCGVPVISVDCPAGPTEVLNKGEFGLLVPNDDPASLADAVERLMNDGSLARRLSAMGYERAQAFDVKNIISEWESVLGSLPRV